MTYPPSNDPYGQAPGQPYAAPAAYTGTAPAFATWIQRVGAYLIDALCVAPFSILAATLGMSTDEATGLPTYNAMYWVFIVLAIAVQAYNRWFQAGKTGQSWGKKALGLKLIGANTGQPIGAGKAFLRDIAHIIDSIICYIGYLFPLWDAKKQTIADKIVSTLVIR